MADPQKILLINFTENIANKVSEDLRIDVHRGYIGRSGQFITNSRGVGIPQFEYSIPNSFAEYKAVFINTSVSDNLKKELAVQPRNLEYGAENPLFRYWYSNKGYLTVFLNDSDAPDLRILGIPMELRDAEQTDTITRLKVPQDSEDELSNLLRDIQKSIIMPSAYYIDFPDKVDDSLSEKTDLVYSNASGDTLGLYLDSQSSWADKQNPRYMILPKFKNMSDVIYRLMIAYSHISPKFIRLSVNDWQDDLSLYPNGIQERIGQIDEIKRAAEARIEEVQGEIETEKAKFSALKGILTETGTPLEESVAELLQGVLGLDIRVSDEVVNGNKGEDLYITYENEPILVEIKGTKSDNPSPKYFGQATNHVANKFSEGVRRCVLVINHAYETDPSSRPLGYTGATEQIMDNSSLVSYVDTRILHRLCLDVLNGDLDKESAKRIFLGSGRVLYPASE